jgi:hypothetical protein
MKTWLRSAVLLGVLGLALGQVVPASAENIGNEGCTPGFWKNHTDLWEEYDPTDTLGELFVFPSELSGFAGITLEAALDGGGGKGLEGGATILMRAAVAAYLNAAHEGVGYPLRRFVDTVNGPALQTQINTALASLDRDTMLDLASHLDGLNNLGSDTGFC